MTKINHPGGYYAVNTLRAINVAIEKMLFTRGLPYIITMIDWLACMLARVYSATLNHSDHLWRCGARYFTCIEH